MHDFMMFLQVIGFYAAILSPLIIIAVFINIVDGLASRKRGGRK